MAEITAQMVSELREKTGLGLMQCKKALSETGGDIEKAIEILRKQGAAVAAKRADKEAKEGKVLVGSAPGVVAAVEINCETDFVASSPDFQAFAGKVLQIILEKKPADADALKALPFEGPQSVGERLLELVGKIGENIGIRRFVCETLGNGEHAEIYSHLGGKIGVVAKVAFSGQAKNQPALASATKDVAMQVAAAMPLAVKPEDISADLVEKEKEIYREQTIKEGKSGPVLDKIVEGRLSKFYKESCLTQQAFIKDPKVSVEKMLQGVAKEQGLDSLTVVSFHRLQLGQ